MFYKHLTNHHPANVSKKCPLFLASLIAPIIIDEEEQNGSNCTEYCRNLLNIQNASKDSQISLPARIIKNPCALEFLDENESAFPIYTIYTHTPNLLRDFCLPLALFHGGKFFAGKDDNPALALYRIQETGDRRQKTEDRTQNTEHRTQNTENEKNSLSPVILSRFLAQDLCVRQRKRNSATPSSMPRSRHPEPVTEDRRQKTESRKKHTLPPVVHAKVPSS